MKSLQVLDEIVKELAAEHKITEKEAAKVANSCFRYAKARMKDEADVANVMMPYIGKFVISKKRVKLLSKNKPNREEVELRLKRIEQYQQSKRKPDVKRKERAQRAVETKLRKAKEEIRKERGSEDL